MQDYQDLPTAPMASDFASDEVALPQEQPPETSSPAGEEAPAQQAVAEEMPEELDPRQLWEEYRKLKQRVGTEEDVRNVKSQRDRLKHELEMLKQSLAQQAAVQQYQQQLQQLQSQYQGWEQQWVQYIDSIADPAAKQAAAAEFERYRAVAQQQLRQAMKEIELASREAQLASKQVEEEERKVVDMVVNLTKQLVAAAGGDPDKLDTSSFSRLQQSALQALSARGSASNVPTPPHRGGRTAKPKDFNSWFRDIVAKRDFRRLDEAIRAATTYPGLTLEDIIRH